METAFAKGMRPRSSSDHETACLFDVAPQLRAVSRYCFVEIAAKVEGRAFWPAKPTLLAFRTTLKVIPRTHGQNGRRFIAANRAPR